MQNEGTLSTKQYSSKYTERNIYVLGVGSISALATYPADIYLLRVNNKDNRTRCELCSKLAIMSFWCLYQ